jgi:branched-chain amino acid transport system ATP-binding protein
MTDTAVIAHDDVLHIKDLTVARGAGPVVRGVSLDIPPGEITALLGPNGAGKSSLVLAVGGVLRPLGGSVVLRDQELTGRRPERIRAAGVAIVPEGRRLLGDLTVEENLEVATYALSREEAAQGRARVKELFPELDKRMGVESRLLSGGEQQMLVLAQALAAKPRFILLDELSLGLAPVVLQRLVPAVRAIADSGIGVLLIEQFATVALGLATRVHVMERGRIRFTGVASELREHPERLQSAYLLGGAALEADQVRRA